MIEPLFISEKFLQAQPPDVQKAILQAGRESVPVERKANEEQEAKVVETLRAKGRTVVVPDVTAFQKAVEPVYEQYGKSIGVDKILRFQSQSPRPRAMIDRSSAGGRLMACEMMRLFWQDMRGGQR